MIHLYKKNSQEKLFVLHFYNRSVSHFMNIFKFYIYPNIFFFSNVFLNRVVNAVIFLAVGGQCTISKQGNPNGEVTMFTGS